MAERGVPVVSVSSDEGLTPEIRTHILIREGNSFES